MYSRYSHHSRPVIFALMCRKKIWFHVFLFGRAKMASMRLRGLLSVFDVAATTVDLSILAPLLVGPWPDNLDGSIVVAV